MSRHSILDTWENWSAKGASALARRPMLASLLLGLIAFLAYLPGQTSLPAVDRTEGVVALSSRYIVESGDYLRPRWGRNIQHTRPVGTFWLQGLSAAAHPEARRNAIAVYRLPSMISTIAAVLLLFWLAGPMVGTMPAMLAAAAVAVTPIVGLHAQLAIAEALILPLAIIAQLSLLAVYRDVTTDRTRRDRCGNGLWHRWGAPAAFWVAIGLSTWFNALALPLLALITILGLTIWDRRSDFLFGLKPWFGLPVFALLTLPWLYSVWAIDGGTLYRGLGWRALLDALEGGQSMKFKTVYGVFILTLAIGFVPVAHMLGPVVQRYWRARRDATVRFLLVWLIVPIIALEIFSNKPPLYTVQVVMPAGALLVAMAVAPSGQHALQVKAWPGMFWGTVVLLALVAPVVFGGVLWVTGTPPTALLVLGFISFVALFLIAAWTSAHRRNMAWFVSGLLGAWLLGLWFNGLMMSGLQNFWTAPQVQRVASQLQVCAPGRVNVAGFREPSLALRAKGHAQISSAAEAAAALTSGTARHAIIETREINQFQAGLGNAGKPRALGCIRSFNLARGCALLFTVFTTAPSSETAACKALSIADCRPDHRNFNAKLKIKHCR